MQRVAALETIYYHYGNYYKIFSGSSLYQLGSQSGAEYFLDDTNKSFYKPTQSISSSDPELLAINAVAAHITHGNGQNVCVFIDSLCTLQFLKQYKPSNYYYIIRAIYLMLDKLKKGNIWF